MDFVLTGVKGIIRKARELENTPFAKDMMAEIALYIMSQIKDRTLDGKDVDGDSFKDYSVGYAEWREQEGYQTAFPDLTVSGHMLSAMTSRSTKREAEIFFMNTQDKDGVSAPDKAFWNNEDREFFGLSKSDEKQIKQIVNRYYTKFTETRLD